MEEVEFNRGRGNCKMGVDTRMSDSAARGKWAEPEGVSSRMQGRGCCPGREAEAERVALCEVLIGCTPPARRVGMPHSLSGSPCLPHC